MQFTAPSWVPEFPFEFPDSITISEFLLEEQHGRYPLAESEAPFTCGISGRTHFTAEVKDRVELLARALAAELNWQPNDGSEWDKVIGIFSVNTIDSMTVSWATHRLSGVSAPVNAAFSVSELENQLTSTGCKALFTCVPLLDLALEAAAKARIPRKHVYLLEVPVQSMKGIKAPADIRAVDHLIKDAVRLNPLEPLRWDAGQGARQTAFLCSSSGTSGLPVSPEVPLAKLCKDIFLMHEKQKQKKIVKISHKNVIANVMQMTAFEAPYRRRERDVSLGLLPQSHSFSLITICHAGVYRGDGVVILPEFDLYQLLRAIQDFKMTRLYVIPPIIIAMVKAPNVLAKHDLSTISNVTIGAAPLTEETAEKLRELQPNWKIIQGYGLTETAVVVACTSLNDVWLGSCGHFYPGYQARILASNGSDVSGLDAPGELLLKSPSITLGYLNNDAANKELFTEDGWMRTGDMAVIRVSPNGFEHVYIVDRIKELIKVKGMQVAPAELEAFLVLHPAIVDVAVVPVADSKAGELPRAYIVRSSAVVDLDEQTLKNEINAYLAARMAHYKQLKGGIEFVETLPKSVSGKILKKKLKERAAAEGKWAMAKKDPVEVKTSSTCMQVFDFDDE